MDAAASTPASAPAREAQPGQEEASVGRMPVHHRRPSTLCLFRRDRRARAVSDPRLCRRMFPMTEESEVGRLVQASAKGDEAAWNALVRRYAPLVLAVIRNYQMAAADAQDVSQTVWLRLVEHLADLRTPEALPGWLVTTTQRECRRYQRRAQKTQPVDPHSDGIMKQAATVDPDLDILRAELRQALRDGLSELPARDQRLLRLRVADPPKSYQEISKLIGIPVGSIGPSLRRSLDRLRQTKAVQAYLATSPAADRAEGRPS